MPRAFHFYSFDILVKNSKIIQIAFMYSIFRQWIPLLFLTWHCIPKLGTNSFKSSLFMAGRLPFSFADYFVITVHCTYVCVCVSTHMLYRWSSGLVLVIWVCMIQNNPGNARVCQDLQAPMSLTTRQKATHIVSKEIVCMPWQIEFGHASLPYTRAFLFAGSPTKLLKLATKLKTPMFEISCSHPGYSKMAVVTKALTQLQPECNIWYSHQ